MKNAFLAAIVVAAAWVAPLAVAADTPEFTIAIKNHRFEPAEVTVPAGKRVKLIIDNQDATAEEFESSELKREKVIAGHSKGIVWVGPLKPGTYPFVGEYHEDTAKGRLIAK